MTDDEFDLFDGFDIDLHIKSMKETPTGQKCKHADCFGNCSEYDVAHRDGECGECYWKRGPVAADHPWLAVKGKNQ